MRQIVGVTFVAMAFLSSIALADPWKDESGRGRGGPPGWAEGRGETPGWARGRGYWDGRLQQGNGETPGWARGRGYWDGRNDRFDDSKARFEDREDRREDWLEDQEDWFEEREDRREDWLEERRDRFDDRRPGWARRGYGESGRYDDHRRFDDYRYGRHGEFREPYDRGYGDPWAQPRYGTGYRGNPPPYRPRRGDDDLDAVYTPFGFYQEAPEFRRPRGPAPEARGQIGPFRFEVWD